MKRFLILYVKVNVILWRELERNSSSSYKNKEIFDDVWGFYMDSFFFIGYRKTKICLLKQEKIFYPLITSIQKQDIRNKKKKRRLF